MGDQNVLQLDDTEQVSFSFAGLDEAGKSTALPAGATATYSVSDNTILTVTPNADGSLGATVAAAGAIGSGQVNGVVTLPDGTQIPYVGNLVVVNSKLAGISVVFGTPSTQAQFVPAPAPAPAPDAPAGS